LRAAKVDNETRIAITQIVLCKKIVMSVSSIVRINLPVQYGLGILAEISMQAQ